MPATLWNPTRRARLVWTIGLLLLVACTTGSRDAGDELPRAGVREVSWTLGDDLRWAAPSFDDALWETVGLGELAGQDGVFWFRANVELSQRHAASTEPFALRMVALATCDLYWDGSPLDTEGEPGQDADSETAGPIESLVYLPSPKITAGPHLLAARCSTHHRQLDLASGFLSLGVGPYVEMVEETLTYSWAAMASLTAKFVAAAYFLALFLVGGRSKAVLYLGLLCLAAAGLLVAEVWRPLIGYTYDWHIPRLIMVLAMAWLCNAFLLLYVLTRFPARGRRTLGLVALGGSLAIIGAVPGFDGRVAFTFLLGLALALGWSLGAVRRAAFGSVLVAVGVGLCLIMFGLDPDRFLDQGVFFSLDGLIALLFVGQALQARRDRDALEAERLRATRLQLELVKKSIQPHFLMNTLTALSEWFERHPVRAIQGIEALSEEVRLLGDLADHKVVPLGRELALCRAHLVTMGLRCGVSYRLDVEGLDLHVPCPPGIIHTMVENAVTHGPRARDRPKLEPIVIALESAVVGEARTYRLTSPLKEEDGAEPDATDGTGLRYVKARLTEAFGSRFAFRAGPREDLWVNEWSVPSTSEPG